MPTSEQARQNRRVMEQAAAIAARALAHQPPAAPPPQRAPLGTVLGEMQAQEDLRAEMDAASDLRIDERAEVDRVWRGGLDACVAKFGRAPSVDSWNQPTDGALMLLRAAEGAEGAFLGAAVSGAPDPVVEQARQRFGEAVLRWINEVTRTWERADAYRQRIARYQEWR